jgi:hypothetical protein
MDKLRRKVEELNRLVDSMCIASKNRSSGDINRGDVMDKARDDIERIERIARTTNNSQFMNLGEKRPKLVSEELMNS